jgi:putative peptide zinc metalloprotease protein
LAGVERRQERLSLTAPVTGRITFRKTLQPGQWVSSEQPLLAVAAAGSPRVTAFVGEQDRHRIEAGSPGHFVPRDGLSGAVPLEVVRVADTAVEQLRVQSLSSRYQGPVAVRQPESRATREGYGGNEQGGKPQEALYRVTLRPAPGKEAETPYWRLPGYAHVEAPPVSLLERGFRKAASVLIRESGF